MRIRRKLFVTLSTSTNEKIYTMLSSANLTRREKEFRSCINTAIKRHVLFIKY